MAITLIAVIFALALGHLAPGFAELVRRHAGWAAWLRWLDAHPPGAALWRGRGGIALALVPPLLLIGLVQYLLHSPLYGLPGLLFAMAALFHAWGPRDLDADVSGIVDAADGDARRDAAARLGIAECDAPTIVEAVFVQALHRWFGVLFWFLLLGASGAVLYRLVALSAEGDTADALPEGTRSGARRLFALLDWLPAQAVALSLTLVGNFDTVLAAWREAGGTRLALGNAFLGAAARASVRSEIAEETQEFIEEGAAPADAWMQLGELPELRDAMSLAWRVLLLWLALLAVVVIAGWVS